MDIHREFHGCCQTSIRLSSRGRVAGRLVVHCLIADWRTNPTDAKSVDQKNFAILYCFLDRPGGASRITPSFYLATPKRCRLMAIGRSTLYHRSSQRQSMET